MHTPVTLYQFTLCPFCNKVRAALDIKGVDYETVEVSPRTKVELPELPEVLPVLKYTSKNFYLAKGWNT